MTVSAATIAAVAELAESRGVAWPRDMFALGATAEPVLSPSVRFAGTAIEGVGPCPLSALLPARAASPR